MLSLHRLGLLLSQCIEEGTLERVFISAESRCSASYGVTLIVLFFLWILLGI